MASSIAHCAVGEGEVHSAAGKGLEGKGEQDLCRLCDIALDVSKCLIVTVQNCYACCLICLYAAIHGVFFGTGFTLTYVVFFAFSPYSL